jgi:hypothetical protein
MPEDMYSSARRPPLKDLSQAQGEAVDRLLDATVSDDEDISTATPADRLVERLDEAFLKGRFLRAQAQVMSYVNNRASPAGVRDKAAVSYAAMGRVLKCSRQHVTASAAGESLLAAHKWSFFVDYFAEQIASFVGPTIVQKRRAGFREAMRLVNQELATLEDAALGGCIADVFLGARSDLGVSDRHALADIYFDIVSASYRDRMRRNGFNDIVFPRMGDDEANALVKAIEMEWKDEQQVLRSAGLPESESPEADKGRAPILEATPEQMAWLREREQVLVRDFGPAFLVTCKVLSVAWRDLEGATLRSSQ